MGRKLTSYNGEDDIYTPKEMARAIVKELKPEGIVLEPCRGDGGFTDVFEEVGLEYEWCEIKDGIDFFRIKKTDANWIITNPPFSQITRFLKKSMWLGVPNLAYLMTVNTIWMTGKLELLKESGYQLQKIYLIESPWAKRLGNWRQSGFTLGVLVIRKNEKGNFPVVSSLVIDEIKW